MKIYGSQGQRALCSIPLGSVTIAMKARRILSAAHVQCDVVKTSHASSARGCIYGIEYPCELSGNVKSLLASAGVQTRST